VNAYDVVKEHHNVLRRLGKKMSDAPVGTPERQTSLDELLVELDIHLRIEDDLYYPAMAAASKLVAIAHAEHRQINDQLAVALRTPPNSPEYEAGGNPSHCLEAHADEEERDLIPRPLHRPKRRRTRTLGPQMTARIQKLRSSTIEKLHVKGRQRASERSDGDVSSAVQTSRCARNHLSCGSRDPPAVAA
jgi:hypothetical protein